MLQVILAALLIPLTVIGATLGGIIVSIPSYLWQGTLVYLAWNLLAPHLNAPLFEWWHCVLITAGWRALMMPRPSNDVTVKPKK